MKLEDISDNESWARSLTPSDDEDSVYHNRRAKKARGKKLRKAKDVDPTDAFPSSRKQFSLQPLLDLVGERDDGNEDEGLFENSIQDNLAEYLECRARHLESLSEVDQLGDRIRPLTKYETHRLLQDLESKRSPHSLTHVERLVARKLSLDILRSRKQIRTPQILSPAVQTLEHMKNPSFIPPPNAAVIKALESIKTTPFSNSFAARLVGSAADAKAGFIARDWDTRSPWMDLIDDIHNHHSLAHPDREQVIVQHAPIDYQSLLPVHLVQIHDLLARTFWAGIDVSDSFQYSPEQCTIVATYKHLVVGAAFLSSPQETYITYLAVRAGWESSQIATNMLYHLITRNPKKDIILHVSANNPAMLLYNRFGFKAEEFIVGFYEDYLDRQSRGSKNAIRLRLRG